MVMIQFKIREKIKQVQFVNNYKGNPPTYQVRQPNKIKFKIIIEVTNFSKSK